MPDFSDDTLLGTENEWMNHWDAAVGLWSPYIRLRRPRFCYSVEDETREGLSGSFAMIRLADYSVVISLRLVCEYGLGSFHMEIMGHEVGHHVYCPADLSDLGRMIARMRAGLPGCEHQAPLVSNLYGDLLINDRLAREHSLRMDLVYEKTNRPGANRFWRFYMRTCEILWSLERGALASGETDDQVESDAVLASRLVRNYGRDWVAGSGGFAAICFPYLVEDPSNTLVASVWADAGRAAEGGGIPSGLAEKDDDEDAAGTHPVFDKKKGKAQARSGNAAKGSEGGSYREPFAYGQILRAMGLDLSESEIAIRYYRERALPHLVPFVSEKKPEVKDPQPEGLDTWDIGSPPDEVDWFETVSRSPVVIPGYTTVERVFGTVEGGESGREPADLDLYVDSSGSMPCPSVNTSYLTLAGAIIGLSALRAGSRVQATLWSHAGAFQTTGGFIADETKILAIITGYIGGGTAFPIHILRDTYATRTPRDRKVHILVISDDGVTTMFDKDERGGNGAAIARKALEKAGGGGTWALNLTRNPEEMKDMRKAAAMGWDIYSVRDWESLVEFSRRFVKRHYEEERGA